jgi:hypothetical protein
MEGLLNVLLSSQMLSAVIAVILTAAIAAFLRWRSARRGNQIEINRIYQSNEISISEEIQQRLKIQYKGQRIEQLFVNRLQITNIGEEDIKDINIKIGIYLRDIQDALEDDYFIEVEHKDSLGKTKLVYEDFPDPNQPGIFVNIIRPFLNHQKAHSEEVVELSVFSSTELNFEVGGGGLGWSTVYHDSTTTRDPSFIFENFLFVAIASMGLGLSFALFNIAKSSSLAISILMATIFVALALTLARRLLRIIV